MKLISGLVLLAAATAASAADEIPKHPLLTDTARLSIGAFYAESTTQARLGSPSGGTGVDVNFEDALGLPEHKWIGQASAYWRMTERWRIDADYFRLSRNGSRVLQADITWGGNPITAGTTVDSSLQISDLRVAAGYSFFKRTDKELGIGLGLHSMGVKAEVGASGTNARSESVTAPLPVLALYGNFALTDTWAIAMRSDWLSLDYDKYSGSIRSNALDIVYQPFKHAAIGVGFQSLNLRLDVDNPNSKFAARVALNGPRAFVSVSF